MVELRELLTCGDIVLRPGPARTQEEQLELERQGLRLLLKVLRGVRIPRGIIAPYHLHDCAEREGGV